MHIMAGSPTAESLIDKTVVLPVNDISRITIRSTPARCMVDQLTGDSGVLSNKPKLNRRTADSPKLGKPLKSELLAKYPEKSQQSIVNFVSVAGRTPLREKSGWGKAGDEIVQPQESVRSGHTHQRKKKEVEKTGSEDEENLEPERSPKIRKISPVIYSTQEAQSTMSQAELDDLLDPTKEMSAESRAILRSIQLLSTQMTENRKQQSCQLKSLEQTINSRFNEQNVRLQEAEKQVLELREEKTREDLENRVKYLEEQIRNFSQATHSDHVVEWLGKVSERLEFREKAEIKFNLIFRGFDMQSVNPVEKNYIFSIKRFAEFHGS